MNVLAVDIGGTNIKLRDQMHEEVIKIPSGPTMTPDKMFKAIHAVTTDWTFDCVSLGFPGPVVHDMPRREPHNLGKGWTKFPYAEAFNGKPVKMINDAAMQALGSYDGGRMLFLGLGTGLGSALVIDHILQPMELAHLPWKKGGTFEDALGNAGYLRLGKKAWTKGVFKVIEALEEAFQTEYTVLGGGNAKLLSELPKNVILGNNANAFKGGFLLWQKSGKRAVK